MTQPLQTIGGEPFDPDVDLAGLALRTLALGASLGAGLECLVLWGTRALMSGAAPTDTPDAGGMFYFVIFGTMASMVVGGGTAWSLLARIGSIWRRAGLSAIAAFATLVVISRNITAIWPWRTMTWRTLPRLRSNCKGSPRKMSGRRKMQSGRRRTPCMPPI